MAKNRAYFDTGAVKGYLEGVLADEEYIKTFDDCAKEVYRVYNYKEKVYMTDVEDWLRGLALGVDYMTYRTVELAKQFVLPSALAPLINGGRTLDDLYWYALADCIWTFGCMTTKNPQFRGAGKKWDGKRS